MIPGKTSCKLCDIINLNCCDDTFIRERLFWDIFSLLHHIHQTYGIKMIKFFVSLVNNKHPFRHYTRSTKQKTIQGQAGVAVCQEKFGFIEMANL